MTRYLCSSRVWQFGPLGSTTTGSGSCGFPHFYRTPAVHTATPKFRLRLLGHSPVGVDAQLLRGRTWAFAIDRLYRTFSTLGPNWRLALVPQLLRLDEVDELFQF
jgi:hypothetical protein